MDWTSTIALITGILGALFGGASLWFARQSARSSEVSARAAEESVAFQIQASRTRNAANLIFVPAHNTDVQSSYRADTDKLTIAVTVFNRGPADAHEISIALESNGARVASESVLLLRALDKRRFDVTVPLVDPEPGSTRTLPLTVHATDRNGRHTWNASLEVIAISAASLSVRLVPGNAETGIGLAVE